jgi:hypothetical protein
MWDITKLLNRRVSMKRKISIILMLSFVLSGCFGRGPDCDSEETLGLIQKIFKEKSQMIMGIWISPNMVNWKKFSVENIRVEGVNKDTGKKSCAADVMFEASVERDDQVMKFSRDVQYNVVFTSDDRTYLTMDSLGTGHFQSIQQTDGLPQDAVVMSGELSCGVGQYAACGIGDHDIPVELVRSGRIPCGEGDQCEVIVRLEMSGAIKSIISAKKIQ